MPRPQLQVQERVLRAITTADWDKKNDRIRASLFKGTDVSVSRLSVFSLSLLLEIFHRDLDGPAHVVTQAGEITVGTILEIGRNHRDKPTAILIEEDPLPDNEAHAEIATDVSRGISSKIVAALILHNSPGRRTHLAGARFSRTLIWVWRKLELHVR